MRIRTKDILINPSHTRSFSLPKGDIAQLRFGNFNNRSLRQTLITWMVSWSSQYTMRKGGGNQFPYSWKWRHELNNSTYWQALWPCDCACQTQQAQTCYKAFNQVICYNLTSKLPAQFPVLIGQYLLSKSVFSSGSLMQRFCTLGFVLGLILMLFGATYILPIATSLYFEDGMINHFLRGMSLSGGVGKGSY